MPRHARSCHDPHQGLTIVKGPTARPAILIPRTRRGGPEVAPGELRPGTPLRDQVHLDSMDSVNFPVALHRRLGVDIPEAGCRKLVAPDELVRYFAARLPAASSGTE
jgi:acyl carrier protein